MENTNKYIWLDKEGNQLDMRTMDVKHLQYAHTHACAKEFKYHELSGKFSDLRDVLEEVAESRNIALSYPDENHPSPKWNGYFCSLRKSKGITLTKVQSLEEVKESLLE